MENTMLNFYNKETKTGIKKVFNVKDFDTITIYQEYDREKGRVRTVFSRPDGVEICVVPRTDVLGRDTVYVRKNSNAVQECEVIG